MRAQIGQGDPVAWRWTNIKTERSGVYLEDPTIFGVRLDHPDYEWTPLYTHPAPQQKPLTDEQRKDLQKVKDSLDPEGWCGDERMVDVLDRVLVASCCVNFAAGTSCFADPKSNCPRLAVAHNIGEKK